MNDIEMFYEKKELYNSLKQSLSSTYLFEAKKEKNTIILVLDDWVLDKYKEQTDDILSCALRIIDRMRTDIDNAFLKERKSEMDEIRERIVKDFDLKEEK